MNIIIRTALPEDFIILSELGKKTFYDTWRSVNTEEDMQDYMKEAFDPNKLKADIENGQTNTFLIAFGNNIPVGYVKLRRDRTYEEFKDDKVLELERIYVLKDWQDKKIGKLLMDQCLIIAENEKHKWFWLGVNIDNIKAINFYKRYDFTIFGEKSFKLGEAVDTDYLMKRKIF